MGFDKWWLLVLTPPVTALAVVAGPTALETVVGPSVSAKIVQEPGDVSWIDAPDQWVPFQAESIRMHADGPEIRGRSYRSSDGSFREETGLALDDIRVIFIANYGRALYYLWNRDHGDEWFVEDAPHLRDLSIANPPRMREGMGWKLHPEALPLRRGESNETGPIHGGFRAYQVDRDNGVVGFQVPALNFRPMVLMRPDGYIERHYNVEIVEPDPTLFEPPAGAHVTLRDPTIMPRAQGRQ